MGDFAGMVILRDGRVRDADVRAASGPAGAVNGDGRRATARLFDRALLVAMPSRGESLAEDAPRRPAGERLAIEFSGTIDNRAELEAQLRMGRGSARSSSDGDLVLRVFEAWGPKSVARLQGAFCFAIYDGVSGQLFAARDRFGVHPFHFVVHDDRVMFSSRLSWLADWAAPTRREIDDDVVAHYLAFGHVPVDRSPLKAFSKLKPAHSLTVQRSGAISQERYWQLASVSAGAQRRPAGKMADELRARLDATITRLARDRGCVSIPTTGDLAGTALVRSAGRAGLLVRPSSIRFVAARKSRAKGRRDAAGRPEGDGVIAVDSGIAGATLSSIARLNEPFGHCEAIRFQAFSHELDPGTLAVSGGGGGELLLAHGRYRRFAEMLANRRNDRMLGASRLAFHQITPFARDLYGATIGIFSDADRLVMAGPALAHTLIYSPADDLGPSLERAGQDDAGDLASRIDLQQGSPAFVAAADIAAANGIAAPRFPFLESEFADLCAAIPQALKGYDPAGKEPGAMLCALAGPADPDDEIPSGAAGEVPIDLWLRTDLRDLMQDTFAGAAFRSRDLFNLPWIDRLVRDHVSGAASHGVRLWSLLCLESWIAAIEPRRSGGVVEPLQVSREGVE